MAKKVKVVVKLQVPAGGANPAPPVGTALGPQGVNIMEFCKQFNERTAKQEAGMIIPVEMIIYTDRSFTFITKVPPVAALLKKAAGIAKASGQPKTEKIAKITKEQVKDIAKKKMPDLNATDINGAIRMVEGTARSMGIEIE